MLFRLYIKGLGGYTLLFPTPSLSRRLTHRAGRQAPLVADASALLQRADEQLGVAGVLQALGECAGAAAGSHQSVGPVNARL